MTRNELLTKFVKKLAMKKIVLLMSLVVMTAMSCSPKLNNAAQSDLKGNWTVTSVTYQNSDVIKVNAFGIADAKCFEGSMWNFIPNNNKGEVSINNANCPAFSSPIVWTITSNGTFTLKFVGEEVKAKNVNQGYYLTMGSQSENAFQLVDYANVAGNNVKVVYQFQKIN